MQNNRNNMQLSEYEKLRGAQKKTLIASICALAFWLGLGVWAGVSKWWWAIPFCAFFVYCFVANTYLTYRLRKKGGNPFMPSRGEVIKWMLTFKVRRYRDEVSEEKSTILADVGKKQMKSGELQSIIGKKTGPNDPCPCGSGKKYRHCCGR